MNEQRTCFIFIFLYGLISLSNGQQQPFPNFGQVATQAQRNPATFQQFLQTRQAATGTFGAGGTGVPTQTAQGQIRTVTVPVLPAPGTGTGFNQFGQATQTQTRAAQADGPIPRFAQGVRMIGRPFTQFGPAAAATQVRTTGTAAGFNNAAILARQRQLAMMRQNAQAQAQAQARQQAAAVAGAQIRPSFDRFGLGENGQMLLLSNRAVNDIRNARNIDRRRFITRTNTGRPASLLTAFALSSGILNDARGRARAAQTIANGGQRGRGTNQQTTRTTQTTTSTRNGVAPGGRAVQSRFVTLQRPNGVNGAQRGNGFVQRTTTTTRTNGGTLRVNGATQRVNSATQRVNGAAQRVNGAAQRVNGAFMRTNGIVPRTNGAVGRQTVTVREETRTRAAPGPMMRPPQNAGVFPPFAPFPAARNTNIAAPRFMMRPSQNAGVFPPFGPSPAARNTAPGPMMRPPQNAGVFPPFAPSPAARNTNIGAGANQRQIQNQQALARARASGGLPPFAVMGGQPRPFGMLPLGGFPRPRPRPTMNVNATAAGGPAAVLWNPDVRMPGMIRPPAGVAPPPGFPGMFPPGFVGGANRIRARQTGRRGFTGASNALFPSQASPVFNPQDPRIGMMPPLANANLMGIGSQLQPFPSVFGVARRPAGANRATVTRTTQTNNIALPLPGGVVPLNEAAAGGTGTVSTTVDASRGSGANSVTTVTETKTITNEIPAVVFPGAESNAATSSTTSTSPVDVPMFPGLESGGNVVVTETTGPEVLMFPGTNDLNTITSISNSVFPGSSSTGETFIRPPPPPVFPSTLIETDSVNVDARSPAALDGFSTSDTRDASVVSSADFPSSSILGDGMSTSSTVSGPASVVIKVVETTMTSEQPTIISMGDMSFPSSTADTTSTAESSRTSNSFLTSNDGVFPASSRDTSLTATVQDFPSRVTVGNVAPSFTADETLGSFPKTEVSSFSTMTRDGSFSVPTRDMSIQPRQDNSIFTVETGNVITSSMADNSSSLSTGGDGANSFLVTDSSVRDSSMSLSPVVDSSLLPENGNIGISIQPSANTVLIGTITTSENVAKDPIAIKIPEPASISVVSENSINFPVDSSFTFPTTDSSTSTDTTITKTSSSFDSGITFPDTNTNEILTVDSASQLSPSTMLVTEVSEAPAIVSVVLTPEPTLPVTELTENSVDGSSGSSISNTRTIIDNSNLDSALRFPGTSLSVNTVSENPAVNLSPVGTETTSISRLSDTASGSTIPSSVSTVTTTVIEESTLDSASRIPDTSSSLATVSRESNVDSASPFTDSSSSASTITESNVIDSSPKFSETASFVIDNSLTDNSVSVADNVPSEPVSSSTSTIINKTTLDSVPRFPESTSSVHTLHENPDVGLVDSKSSVINVNVNSGPDSVFPNSASSMSTTIIEKSTLDSGFNFPGDTSSKVTFAENSATNFDFPSSETSHSDMTSVIDNSGTDVTLGISESVPTVVAVNENTEIGSTANVVLVPTIDESMSSTSVLTDTSAVDSSLPATTAAVDSVVVDSAQPTITATVDNVVVDPVLPATTAAVDIVVVDSARPTITATVDNVVVDPALPVITSTTDNVVVDPVLPAITAAVDNVDNVVVDSPHFSSDSKSSSTITTITETIETSKTGHAGSGIAEISTADNSFNTNSVSDSSISVFPGTETSAVDTTALQFPGTSSGMTETSTITETNISAFPGSPVDSSMTDNAITDSSFAMFPGTLSTDSSTSTVTSSSSVDNSLAFNTENVIADSSLGAFPGTSTVESSKDLGAFPGTSAAEWSKSSGAFSGTSTSESSKDLGAFPGTSAAEWAESSGVFQGTSTAESSKDLGAFPGTSAAEWSKSSGTFQGTSTAESSKDLGAFPGTSAAELSKLTVGEISKFTHSVNDGSPQIVVFPGTSNTEEIAFPNTGEGMKTLTTVTETTSTSSNGFTDNIPVVEGTFMDNTVVMDTKGSTTDVRAFPDSTGSTVTSQDSTVLLQDFPGSGTTQTDITTVDNTQIQDFPGNSDGQQLNMIPGEDPMGAAFSGTNSVRTQTITGKETITTTNSQDSVGSSGTNTAIVDSSFASFPEGEAGFGTFADSRTVKQIIPRPNAVESSSTSSFSSTISSNAADITAMDPNLGDSASPMSFSLTVQGGEKPFGPGEFPPPPPVFPAGDISSIPASADASLFGPLETVSTSSGAEVSSAGSSSSSSVSSSSSSSSSGLETGAGAGGSASTVEVTKFESSSVNSNSIPEFPTLPGENIAANAPSAGIYQRGNGLVMAVLDLTNADKNNLGEMMQILQSLIDERRRHATAPVDTLPSDAMFPAGEGTSSVTSTSETSVSSFPGVEPVFPGTENSASSTVVTEEFTGNVPSPTLPPDAGAGMFPAGEGSSSFSSTMTSKTSVSSFPGVEPGFPGVEPIFPGAEISGNPGGVPIDRWPSGF